MSVKVIETTTVYPAEKTPRRSLWLSKLDRIIRQPFSHTRTLFIYHYPNDVSTNTDISTFFDVNILKNALSNVLVPFYPLAGRLNVNEKNGRYEINCNEEGVIFVEAETTCSLGDLGDEFTPNYSLQKELFPECDYSKGISEFPLFISQITRFKCGGVTLGMAVHHHIGDGVAHLHSMNSWASLARGIELSVMPCHDRALFLAHPRHPFQVAFRHLEYEPSFQPVLPNSISGEINNATEEQLFRLSRDQMNALKLTAISHHGKDINLSTFKVLAAHVWRSVCKARGLAGDQDVKLYMHTSGRSKLKEPTLPRGYFGNVIFFSCCVAKAGDLIRNPLWYTIAKIDEAVKRTDNSDYLRSAIDYLESQEDLTSLVRGPHSVTSPNLQINSWVRLPFSTANFGWGGPQYIRLGEIKSEGQSKIIASLAGDKGFCVGIRLFTSHMGLFRKCFYDF